MSDITYKIKEFNEKEPLASVVEKHGSVVEFSMVGVQAHKDQMNKLVAEITAQKGLEEAKMKNIEEHHEFVQKMSDEDLHTAAMYWESKHLAKRCAEKLTEFAEQMKKDDAEVEEIYRQCPDLLLQPSPAEAVPENAVATPENAEVHEYDGPMGKYKITGVAPYTDENGVNKGELEIGSIQELPKVVGDQMVEAGVAEVVAEEAQQENNA